MRGCRPGAVGGTALGPGNPAPLGRGGYSQVGPSTTVKHSKALVQIIDNPSKPRTSLRSASELVDRKVMEWVTFPFTVRLRTVAQRLDEQATRRIASERGGADIGCVWSVTRVRATPNQREGIPAILGYAVLGARTIAVDREATA